MEGSLSRREIILFAWYREACTILDIAYNIGGSEAIAETYFGVMTSQHKDNQSNDTLDMRTLISFCMPKLSKCPNAVSAIAEIYLKGDLAHKVAKHRSFLFTDAKQRAASKYRVSRRSITSMHKAIDASI